MTSKTQLSSMDIKFKKGYKFEIKPTKDQKDYLHMAFGHTRFVWNNVLESLKGQYDLYMASGTDKDNRDNTLKPDYSYKSLSARLPAMKSNGQFPWLKEVSAVALQQSLKHLSEAYKRFFDNILKRRKAGFPKFKSKYRRQSISLTKSGFTLDGNDLYIAKVSEPIKVYWSRDLPSYPSSITISKESNGRYFVSFQCDYIPHKTNGTNIVGVDLGVHNFYVDSDGNKEESLLPSLVPLEKVIRRLQRQLSRKEKNSMAYNRLKRRIAKWHLRIRNVRNDILHKLSRKLVDNNHVIVLETLAVENMLKNHCLARIIQMVSWSKFVEYVRYKTLESQHTIVARAHQFYPSSKTCSVCGVLNTDLKLKDRHWTCESCQTKHDRDENASYNLKGLFLNWSIRTNTDLSVYAGMTISIK